MQTKRSVILNDYAHFDENTRTPDPLPPKGSWDGQIHVFADPLKHPPREGAGYVLPDATVDAALRMHKALGIDHGVVVQTNTYGADHTVLLEALDTTGPAYSGCAVIDESLSEHDLDLLHEGGVRGIRLNFFAPAEAIPTLEQAQKRIRRAEARGWYVKFVLRSYRLLLDELASTVQATKAPIIIDHLASIDCSMGVDGTDFQSLLGLLDRGNVWMNLSCGDVFSKTGFPWSDSYPYAQAYIEHAPERVI